MKEALDGSTHRHFPATARVCRARRSLPEARTQVRVHQVRRGVIRCAVFVRSGVSVFLGGKCPVACIQLELGTSIDAVCG